MMSGLVGFTEEHYTSISRGRLFALADMDHVYDDCKHGLIENIRFLYHMMVEEI